MTVAYYLSAQVVAMWCLSMVIGFNVPDLLVVLGRPVRAGGPADRLIGVCRSAYWELRPFFPAAWMVQSAHWFATGDISALDWFFHIMVFVFWFIPRGDDDRWKRRRRKVEAVVRRLASGRLVVLPAAATR